MPGTSFTVWVEGKEGEWSWSVLLSGVVLDGGVKEEPGEAKAAALRFIEATALVIRPVERDNKKEGES